MLGESILVAVCRPTVGIVARGTSPPFPRTESGRHLGDPIRGIVENETAPTTRVPFPKLDEKTAFQPDNPLLKSCHCIQRWSQRLP